MIVILISMQYLTCKFLNSDPASCGWQECTSPNNAKFFSFSANVHPSPSLTLHAGPVSTIIVIGKLSQVNESDNESNKIWIGSDLSTKSYGSRGHRSVRKTCLIIFARATLWNYQQNQLQPETRTG